MSKAFRIFSAICFIMLVSCEEDQVGTDQISTREDSIITTDKISYFVDESVVFIINNTLGEELRYYVCSGSKTVPYLIYRLDGKSWKAEYAPLCNGLSSFCCRSVSENEVLRDTISSHFFSKGVYRFGAVFHMDNEHKEYFSNSFQVN